MKRVRMLKVTPSFELTQVECDMDTYLIGEVLYGEGSLAQEVNIMYDVFNQNLLENDIHSKFVMLADEEGLCKQLDLNLIGTIFYGGNPIVGDIAIIKIGREDFVDMFDRELEIIKSQLHGMIDVVTEEVAKSGFDLSNPSSFGGYEE